MNQIECFLKSQLNKHNVELVEQIAPAATQQNKYKKVIQKKKQLHEKLEIPNFDCCLNQQTKSFPTWELEETLIVLMDFHCWN